MDYLVCVSTITQQSICFYIATSLTIAQYVHLSKEIDNAEEVETTRTNCNKDTGERHTLQKWSRGTFFCVSGGGHIHMWQPLYQ